MTLPLPLFVGLRYVRARSSQFFVSFITWISILGICVGVAALITILSVMNGFEAEGRSRLLSLSSHATVSDNPAALTDWPRQVAAARRVPGVVGAAPYVELQALMTRDPEMSGAVLRGIDPQAEANISSIGRSMIEGRLDLLVPGTRNIVLGQVLAYMISASVGDTVTVMIPVSGTDGTISPRIQRFTVCGIFEVGMQEHDGSLALVHLQDALALQSAGSAATGIRLKFADVFAAPTLARSVARQLGGGFRVSDWTQENASYLRAIRIEKTMMTLLLLLIVAVAAFNIVAALVMVVTDKRTDIAILRTLGLRPRQVLAVFMTQGVVIGWLGAVLGVIVGLTLALNVDVIVPWLEQTLNFHIMDPSVYYITEIPSDVHVPDVVAIAATAFGLTVLATLYPAFRAAHTSPAEALRYE